MPLNTFNESTTGPSSRPSDVFTTGADSAWAADDMTGPSIEQDGARLAAQMIRAHAAPVRSEITAWFLRCWLSGLPVEAPVPDTKTARWPGGRRARACTARSAGNGPDGWRENSRWRHRRKSDRARDR